MVDTISIKGYGCFYKFKKDYERFMGFRRNDGTHYIVEQTVENKKGKYVARYSPASDVMRIEFNLGKLLFGRNVYNYESSPGILLAIIGHAGRYFFGNNEFYIARIDIGGVCTYKDEDEATNVLNSMRNARPDGARMKSYLHQNYSDSVFHRSENWSTKIYNKGVEMKESRENPDFKEFNLFATLRFEKTYRYKEISRVSKEYYYSGEKKHYRQDFNIPVKGMGIPFKNFNIRYLLDDFYKYFTNWDHLANTILAQHEVKGSALNSCLRVIDELGKLNEFEVSGIVSQRTMHRYRQKKKDKVDFKPFVSFQKNIDTKSWKILDYARTFGLATYFN